MTQTTARITKAGKHFEIIVDLEAALKFRKEGVGSSADFLEIDTIFKDSKKGENAPSSDIKDAFGTENVSEIAENIVKKGEVLVTQEVRSAEQEARFKQVVDFLATNAIDPQSGNPLTGERIKSALDQSSVNIKNIPVESQIKEIMEGLSSIIPIKLDTKKVKITIPAQHTGQAYGVVQQYKETENWNDDGSLEMLLSVPSGILIDFYEKLNNITHGSALSEEVKE
jgi:ribosome maturation protein SDO1